MKWITRIFNRKKSSTMMEMRPLDLEKMIGMLNKTQNIELTCDEVHRLIDQYAEMVLRGEDPSYLMPLVTQHLDLCPDCREEFEALMAILDQ